nr:sulfotransferase [Nocardioides daedukensis]
MRSGTPPPAGDAATPVPVLFLAGLGRSGTTLIERTLGEARGIHGLGEVMHLWERGIRRNELCACGVPFLQCPFWTRVGAAAFGGWAEVDVDRMAWLKARVDRARRIPAIASGARSLRAEVQEYVAAYALLYRAAHELTGSILIDSSKQVSLAWCLARSPDIDLRVLHCVRDSRGVAHSWAKSVRRPEAVGAEHQLMARLSSWEVSRSWIVHNAGIEPLGRSVPLLRLRYEDFVTDPVTSSDRALRFAGIDAGVGHIHRTTVMLQTTHSCAGNPMRFRTGAIDLVPDVAWREHQDPAQRRAVTAFTAPLLARYGYLR